MRKENLPENSIPCSNEAYMLVERTDVNQRITEINVQLKVFCDKTEETYGMREY